MGDHSNDHAHHHTPESFNLAFGISVGLNLAFTFIEAVYAVMANSMSLLADAGHNLGDVLGLLFAWGASYLVTKAATEKFSYGYKRSSILAALFNSLLLVGTSAIIAYESINKLMYPAYVNEWIVIIVALIGIAINGGTALLFMRGRKDDLNIKGAFLHLAYDALISLAVVIVGIIILYTGWMWLDPIVGLAIVTAILWGTWGLLRDSTDLILDAVPRKINRTKVVEFLENIEGVKTVHDLHIWGLGTKDVALTCHLVIPDRTFSGKDYQDLHRDLAHKFDIRHSTIQVESGNTDLDCGHSCD
jgi:cobalt-zinc-cadmium efflux system protein